MIDILARQAALLDLMFYRVALEACSNEGPDSYGRIRNALRAQDLCRKILKALPGSACRRRAGEKFRRAK